MRAVATILLACLVSGCATSGKVVNYQFIDNVYNFKISFPVGYRIITGSKGANQRVRAYSRKYGEYTLLTKPMIFVSIQNGMQGLDEFALSMQDKHSGPSHDYWQYAEEGERDIRVKDRPTRLVYFSSKSQTQSPSKNKGITAYVKLDSTYLVVEYISSASWYDANEFLRVLETIDFREVRP